MRFKPTVNAEVGISEWKIITSQNDVDLKTFSGKGEPPAQIDWFAAQEDEQEFIPKMDEPLDYRMEIVDNDGKVLVSKKQTLPVDQITIQKKIFAGESDKIFNKFSMIGFPYNSDEIQGRNMDMLKSVNRAIEDNSEIFVSGYSDRLGDDDYNLRLAQRRANAVGKALKVPAANISALGESRLLYDNEMPEGRFYSRTVLIDVVTVIE
jgi:outer membrane protein OmpA-like peptidoglycan-associated protein